MKKAFLPLIVLAPLAFALPAQAAGPAPAGVERVDSVLLVRDRDRSHRSNRRGRIKNIAPGVHRHHHHRYVPGRHYRSAPHGWHRYHSRPYNWRARGCIVVGPIWFCP